MGRRDKGKGARDSRINLIRGQWVHPENYNYLHRTQLHDLCYSVSQFISLACGSIVVV